MKTLNTQELLKHYKVVEFSKLEKELAKYLPEIKRRYKLFYEKVIKLTNYELH